MLNRLRVFMIFSRFSHHFRKCCTSCPDLRSAALHGSDKTVDVPLRKESDSVTCLGNSARPILSGLSIWNSWQDSIPGAS